MHSVTKKPLHILLTPKEQQSLGELCDKMDTNRSSVMRLALRALHAHEVTRRPTCADANNCVMPHLHPMTHEKKG